MEQGYNDLTMYINDIAVLVLPYEDQEAIESGRR